MANDSMRNITMSDVLCSHSIVHFMIECDSYVEERCLLFHTAVAHHPSLTSLDVKQQMILLLCSGNPSIIMSISKFVHACLLKRNVLISD